jgi:hypothetical protein
MEYADLGLCFWIDAGNSIPHRLVVVGDSDLRGIGANFYLPGVDLIHEPVEALLTFVVDEAERTTKKLPQIINANYLEERKPLIVRIIRIVVHLHPVVHLPLLFAPWLRPK